VRSVPLLTLPFVLSWAASFFEGLAFSLYLHFPGYLQELGASEVQIGLVVGSAAISAVMVRPWVGRAVDTRGRRPVIIAGSVINVTALAIYLSVGTLGPWLYAVRILHGVAVGILFTSLFTYAADVVPLARRTQGLAIFGVSGLLPIGLGGLIGDVVLGRWDFTALFLIALAFGVLSLILVFALRETAILLGGDVDGRQGFFSAVRLPTLRPLWFIAGVFSFVLTAYFTFLKTFVNDTAIGSLTVFFGLYAATAILLRVLFGWLPDRLGARRVLYPALGLLAVGLLVLARADSAADVGLAGILSGIGHGFGFPILIGMVVTRAPDPDRGSAIAIFTAEFDLGLLVGGPALGAIIATWGYTAMFTVSAVLLAGATVVFARWDRADAGPA
jgi:MFS family permease